MIMSAPTREVAWGEGIVVAGFRTPGGLKNAVTRIHSALGPTIGTRNTFAKLYQVRDPHELNELDLIRAWLLLTALNQEPNEWGISDDVLPAGYNPETLRCAIRDSNPEPADSIASLVRAPFVRLAA